MSQRSRLQDVADAAGVSFITAWRALNKPDIVREKTVAKVQAAAEDVGYVGNAIARSLVTARSGVVGVVIPTLDDSIFAATVEGLSDAFSVRGREMLIGISHYEQEREATLIRAFLGRQIDALVLTGSNHSPPTRALLEKSGVTIVEIWDMPDEPIDLFVGFSNTELAATGTHYLISKGYRRIAFVSPEGRGRAAQREAGYVEAMTRAGLGDNLRTHWAESTLNGGADALEGLLADETPPDAIFFNGDTLAVGAHLRGAARGLRYPDDIALLGLHGIDISTHVNPPLTTIHLPRYEIGQIAAKEIIARLDDGKPATSQRVAFSISEGGTT